MGDLMSLSRREWRRLPEEEKSRYRAERRARAKAERDRRARSKDQAAILARRNHAVVTCPATSPFVNYRGERVNLCGIAQGSPCFIVLSGPSLADLDLSLLNRRGVFTFGVNNSPTLLRVNAWTYVDKARKFHEAIWCDPAVLKIVPSRHFDHELRTKLPDGTFMQMRIEDENGPRPVHVWEMPNVIGYDRNADYNPDKWLSESTINWGNGKRNAIRNHRPRILNVMFAVMKIAYSLGFRHVFLLGCDFNMTIDRPYAFDQSKEMGGVNGNQNSYSTMNQMFADLQPRFLAADFRVYNCNPCSGLTAFPFVEYTEAVDIVSDAVKQDPLDAKGWYDC